MDIKFEEFTFTPHMAKAYFDKSEKTGCTQRNINPAHVKYLAGEMLAGRWKSTPTSPIGITSDGFIFDGQHRILAITQAKINVSLFVAFNATSESFDVIDRGQRRSDNQIAIMSESKSSGIQFAAIHRAYQSPESTFLRNAKIRQGSDCVKLCEFFKDEVELAFNKFTGSQIYLLQNFRAAIIRACKVYPDKKELILEFLKLSVTGERSSISDKVLNDTQQNLALFMNQHLSRCPGNRELSNFDLYKYTLKCIYCVLNSKRYATYRNFNVSKNSPDGYFYLPTDSLNDMTISEAIDKVSVTQ